MLDFHGHGIQNVRPGMPSRLPRLLIRVGRNEAPVVTLAGEVDASTSPKLQQCLESLHGRVVVDLDGVTFVDLCGLEVLAAARRKLRAHDGDLVFRTPQEGVRRALQLTGLDGLVLND